jgi:hypothetical protein
MMTYTAPALTGSGPAVAITLGGNRISTEAVGKLP